MLIEICCDGISAARKARALGAERVELCSDLRIGGVTPPYAEIEAAAGLATKVNVLVRPRGGDFVYTGCEAEKMVREIAFCGCAGVNGVVLGALDKIGKIDVPLCRELIAVARSYGLSVTFHRAIDQALSISLGGKIPRTAAKIDAAAERAVEGVMKDVMGLGVDRILTSGGARSALRGRFVIALMQRLAEKLAGENQALRLPVIMPGGGICRRNLSAIVSDTGAGEIHGSRLSLLKP